MNQIPLFFYPTTWAFVDDEPSFLNSIAHIFKKCNRIITFESAQECKKALQQYKETTGKYNFLTVNPDDELIGVLQKSPVNLDVTQLANLATDKNKYSDISVVTIDYNMPECSGLQLAQALSSHPSKKILLTGKASNDEVIAAFNHQLINRYTQKGNEYLLDELNNYINDLTNEYFLDLTNNLLSHLQIENKLPLCDQQFINFFKKHCKDNNISEYYLIDKQGSFLLVDENGNNTYLVVHTDNSLNTWVDVFSENDESDPNIQSVKERKKIPFFGLGKEGWELKKEDWSNNFYAPKVLEGNQRYYLSHITNQ